MVNNAVIRKNSVIGQPTEGALLALAMKVRLLRFKIFQNLKNNNKKRKAGRVKSDSSDQTSLKSADCFYPFFPFLFSPGL